MLSKLTAKNQLTIPKAIADSFPDVEYFDVRQEKNYIVLTPVRPSRAEEVREQLARYGITEGDVTDAVDWARADKNSAHGSVEQTSPEAGNPSDT